MSWTREPFVRFIALGALIFATHAAVGPRRMADDKRIVVSSADIAGLRAMALKQWGREPGPDQMGEVIRSFVREEVLVREALASGLDRDDVIVRRRLAQKMEFLAQENVRVPDDAQLQAYFRAHAAEYVPPPTLQLEHVFFSKELRGDKAEADAAQALAALQGGQPVHGDRFMLGTALAGQTEAMLSSDFGAPFAHATFALTVGTWSGPIASPLGVHLVRVVARSGGTSVQLDDVRERVHADLLNQRVAQAREQAYAQARAHYTVTVAGETWRIGAGAPPAVQP